MKNQKEIRSIKIGLRQSAIDFAELTQNATHMAEVLSDFNGSISITGYFLRLIEKLEKEVIRTKILYENYRQIANSFPLEILEFGSVNDFADNEAFMEDLNDKYLQKIHEYCEDNGIDPETIDYVIDDRVKIEIYGEEEV